MKNIKLFLVLIICFIFSISSLSAKNSKAVQNKLSPSNNSKIKIIASPNWVHPNLRENHKGYSKIEMQKQYSSIWQHSLNRQSGNIKGGGTTQYYDYVPFYHPSQKY